MCTKLTSNLWQTSFLGSFTIWNYLQICCLTQKGAQQQNAHSDTIDNCFGAIWLANSAIVGYNFLSPLNFQLWHSLSCPSLFCSWGAHLTSSFVIGKSSHMWLLPHSYVSWMVIKPSSWVHFKSFVFVDVELIWHGMLTSHSQWYAHATFFINTRS